MNTGVNSYYIMDIFQFVVFGWNMFKDTILSHTEISFPSPIYYTEICDVMTNTDDVWIS